MKNAKANVAIVPTEVQAITPVVAHEHTVCRRDCVYFSTYTNTCDYSLMEIKPSPSRAACTVYKRRVAAKSWQERSGAGRFGGGDMTADCGHGITEGEEYYANDSNETICAECVERELNRLETNEKAELIGYDETRIYGCAD